MRSHLVFVPAVAALALAACRESPAEPYLTSAPAPTGLLATIAPVPRTPGVPPSRSAHVAVAGDSVVVTVTLGDACASDRSARAGVAGGDLVLTVVDTPPPRPRVCLAIATISDYRVVARPVRRGRYQVVLRQRFVRPDGRAQEVETLRRRVTVR